MEVPSKPKPPARGLMEYLEKELEWEVKVDEDNKTFDLTKTDISVRPTYDLTKTDASVKGAADGRDVNGK
jgi:hypothetical protein